MTPLTVPRVIPDDQQGTPAAAATDAASQKTVAAPGATPAALDAAGQTATTVSATTDAVCAVTEMELTAVNLDGALVVAGHSNQATVSAPHVSAGASATAAQTAATVSATTATPSLDAACAATVTALTGSDLDSTPDAAGPYNAATVSAPDGSIAMPDVSIKRTADATGVHAGHCDDQLDGATASAAAVLSDASSSFASLLSARSTCTDCSDTVLIC